ncbi:MAG: 4-hydroxy-tetrahydrodipicolinate reductase [Elusimicrobia bacterium RIFOXYA2_FULL_39_19]|nr:MAG: 4-hydroxy-tetrahydrodipicolinate reductase [Elusimicrobia bacterium RIFOXYA2_FULL_39_19]
MIKIAVIGIGGKMGSRIASLCTADPALELIAGTEAKGHPLIGSSKIQALSRELPNPVADSLDSIISKADIVIDFSTTASTLTNLAVALKAKKAIVIGTTGFKENEIKAIEKASKEIPVVLSPNMSVGVNLLFKLVKETAKVIPGYDIEIIEAHHNQKKDAPSGTALKLAEEINSVLDEKLNVVTGRDGLCGPRKKNEIGVLAVRAGDIVGDHTVMFAGPAERLELIHRAHSRDALAGGALCAAKWLADKKPGLYNMQDVLFKEEN